MILPHKCNPGLVVSKDETRYSLGFVKIETRMAIATDGRSMIVQTVYPGENDARSTAYIRPESLKAATKRCRFLSPDDDTIQITATGVQLDNDIPATYSQTWPEPEAVDYPNWTQVVPDKKVRIRIGLDARKLLKLSRAMQGKRSSQVFIDIDPDIPNSCMIVTCQHNDGFGLLMPVYDNGRKDPSSDALEKNSAWIYAHSLIAEQRAASKPQVI